MPERWRSRDLPVLRWIVEQFDDPSADFVDNHAIATALDISADEASAAVANLERGGFVRATWSFGAGCNVDNITERALRESGTWPDEQSIADQLLWILEQKVEQATSSDERTKWSRVRDSIAGAGRDVAVELAAAILSKQMGI